MFGRPHSISQSPTQSRLALCGLNRLYGCEIKDEKVFRNKDRPERWSVTFEAEVELNQAEKPTDFQPVQGQPCNTSTMGQTTNTSHLNNVTFKLDQPNASKPLKALITEHLEPQLLELETLHNSCLRTSGNELSIDLLAKHWSSFDSRQQTLLLLFELLGELTWNIELKAFQDTSFTSNLRTNFIPEKIGTLNKFCGLRPDAKQSEEVTNEAINFFESIAIVNKAIKAEKSKINYAIFMLQTDGHLSEPTSEMRETRNLATEMLNNINYIRDLFLYLPILKNLIDDSNEKSPPLSFPKVVDLRDEVENLTNSWKGD